MTISCNGCTERWTAVGAAHCSGCHRTFSTYRLFDLHRSTSGEHGVCLDPASVKKNGENLLDFRNGMWRGPEMTEEQKARAGW